MLPPCWFFPLILQTCLSGNWQTGASFWCRAGRLHLRLLKPQSELAAPSWLPWSPPPVHRVSKACLAEHPRVLSSPWLRLVGFHVLEAPGSLPSLPQFRFLAFILSQLHLTLPVPSLAFHTQALHTIKPSSRVAGIHLTPLCCLELLIFSLHDKTD